MAASNDRDAKIERAARELLALAEKRPDLTIPRSELIHQARLVGTSERTLQRRVKSLRRQNLVRPPAFEFDEELSILAIAYGHRRLKVLHQHLLDTRAEHGRQIPSYTTFWRTWTRTPELKRHRAYVRKNLGLSGVRKALLHVRFSSKHRNQLWQADICELDVKVRVMSGGRIVEKRPRIVAFMDDRSRMIMGWALGFDRLTALDVLNAFVDAARTKVGPGGVIWGGMCAAILWDNATEFNNETMLRSLLKAGVVSWAPMPWLGSNDKGKIERWFHTLQETGLSDLPGYMKSPSKRNKKPHAEGADLVDINELHAKFRDFVNDYNFNRVHSSLRGRTPFEVWSADNTPLTTREVPDLLRLVPKDAIRSRDVENDGIVQGYTHYASADPWFDLLPEKVNIWYPPSEAPPEGCPDQLEVLVNGVWKGTAKRMEDLTSDERRRINQFQEEQISYFEDIAEHKNKLQQKARKYPDGKGRNNIVKGQLELDLQYGETN